MAVHVFPIDDWIEHRTEDFDCVCEPVIHLVDASTGKAYEQPLVVHNAVDGRRDEIFESGGVVEDDCDEQ